MVYPVVFLCSSRIPNCSELREEEIILGKVSDSPKNAYFRVSDSALSSILVVTLQMTNLILK